MFNNLIESSSHKCEFKRRGSFFVYTIAAYVLLFTTAGVVSIYAYDAHLDEQNDEITITFVPPEPVAAVRPAAPNRPNTPTPNGNPHTTVPSAPVLYESTTNPHTPPVSVSTAAVEFPPAGPRTVVGPLSNPLTNGSSDMNTSGPGGGSGDRVVIDVDPPLPPAAAPTPVPKRIIVSPRILNSTAIFLPKPVYPEMAKQIHLSGSVSVQVLIDENGRVVSARSISGHALFVNGAVRAAQQARFSPTLIGDTPMKVSGVIVYNFVLNQ